MLEKEEETLKLDKKKGRRIKIEYKGPLSSNPERESSLPEID